MIKDLSITGLSIVIKGETGLDRHTPYYNSPSGRTALATEQLPEIVAEVMAVWGDTPTVPDNVPQDEPPAEPTTPTPTIEQRTTALESAMLAVMTAAQGGIADV